MGSQISGPMKTLYESREKKGIKIDFNPEVASEIENYLGGMEVMLETYQENEEIVRGLKELKAKASSLLISHSSEEEIIKGIRQLTSIKGPDGKQMNISSFGRKSATTKDADKFKERTVKLLKQTNQNTIALMQWDSKNKELAKFLGVIKEIDLNIPPIELDKKVKELLKSDGFRAYQAVKESYIKEWLKPFQEELGKPIEALSQEELQEAMKRMKIVMKQRMTEGNLIVTPDSEKFKDFNVHDHDLVNGNEKKFWLNEILIDEFIAFTQAVLTRFTFLLDKQFLVFQFRNEPYLYLIGFSHDAFINAEQGADGTMIISPHVKPIIPGKDKTYRELSQTTFPSVGLYTEMCRETLKPFFMSLGEKIGFVFSKEFKQHFRMS
ncbi:hypothetical protein WDW89_05780 [Deltaproteobacteria bacterium TL4]